MKSNTLLSILVVMTIALTGATSYLLVQYHRIQSNEQELTEEEEPLMEMPNHQGLTFAGEKLPLEHFDVYESFDREMYVNTYYHSQTYRLIKMAPRFFAVIEPILEEEGVPNDFKYLAVAESGLFPTIVSPAGAVGIWQFMKSTGREYGLEINSEVDERYHLEKATRAACKYIKKAYKKYGNWTMVAAAYNVGNRGVQRQIDRQKEDDYYNLLLNTETGRYVYRIVALKTILSAPEAYGFHVDSTSIYPIISTKSIAVDEAVKDFADFAKQHGTNYKVLKYFNPWLRDTHLTNRKQKHYEILIPNSRSFSIENENK